MTTNLKPLANQTAFITAGAAAISMAAAKLLARDGAAMVLMGRRLDALQDAKAIILASCPDARVEVHSGDACVEADVVAGLRKAYDLSNRLDIVISAVGGSGFKPLLMLETEELINDLTLNIVSAFLATKHAVPLMQRGGSIVCVSSIAAKLTYAYLSSYNTAKAGLEGFVRIAADELGGRGIRVNAVRPGMTRSGGTAGMFVIPSVVDRVVNECTLGRLGEPEDIAPAIRYFAGPESSWVTGQSFAVDGGNELRRNPDLSDLVVQMFGPEAVNSSAVRA
ncbi:SDR family NAD(P)-dependent oxidoreductase [Burkholderia cenocepacia]|uniref:SDR family NAD(P)-dependent oxidoreductase n=1 Tax=Burkholderia cenocepacia TaxID=95486 RepID=UPI001CF445B3|nr:SDR family oxidoreductase [Burkholderia cenocepacia]MCA8010208.1 SDR family oxidoreductase [Burkholderia cenocepacia]